MKTLLKTLLILLLIGGMVAGGIYGYSRYTMSQPVKVQPVANWLLKYSPNQTYLGGSVTYGTSMILYGERNRVPLEVYVSEGQTVHVGDPLLRYDTTKDAIDLDEKLLNRQKLYDDLQVLYKDYKRYAFEEYERTIPTATPTATPTPRGYKGVSAKADGSLGIVRLSATKGISSPVQWDLIPKEGWMGDGSKDMPYRYVVYSINDSRDPVPAKKLSELQREAVKLQRPVYAWFEMDVGNIYVRFAPPESAFPKGSFSLAFLTKQQAELFKEPTGIMNIKNAERQEKGRDGTVNNPLLYSYTEGQEVPKEFFAQYSGLASNQGKFIYAELWGRNLILTVDFTSMGTCNLRLRPAPEPTPEPTPTPELTPTPTPTATPEGWTDAPETPYVPPRRGGMSKAERLALVESLTEQIRDAEHTYKQLEHDIELLTVSAQSGTVTSTIDGVVSKVDPAAKAGTTLLEIRGGSGKSYISCMLGETDLNKYPIGTELTGFSYDVGENVTAVVTYVSPMPVTESYNNGGNPNSSGYTMLLEVQGDVELNLFSYVEFTSFEPLSRTGAIYLYEAFVREIEGQDCIFVARDGILKKVQVHTGRRTMEYIELVGSDLKREDYIAFPYDKNVRDGASVVVTDGSW